MARSSVVTFVASDSVMPVRGVIFLDREWGTVSV
jgi:hypothetical protein